MNTGIDNQAIFIAHLVWNVCSFIFPCYPVKTVYQRNCLSTISFCRLARVLVERLSLEALVPFIIFTLHTRLTFDRALKTFLVFYGNVLDDNEIR